MPQLRQPTFRCFEDDLQLKRPPLTVPMCRALDDTATTAARKLVRDFCHDTGPAEQGKRIASVSEAAARPIFRRRHSDTRGLTWYDRDAAQQLPDPGILAGEHTQPGIEWMLLADMRRADEAYDEGVRLAASGALLPTSDDYLRAHAEFATYIARRLPAAVRELLDNARANPGTVIEGTITWGIPAKLRVEYDDQVDEVRIALPRSSGTLADRVETAMLAQFEDAAELIHEEILQPGLVPTWVPAGWRCFHFVTAPY